MISTAYTFYSEFFNQTTMAHDNGQFMSREPVQTEVLQHDIPLYWGPTDNCVISEGHDHCMASSFAMPKALEAPPPPPPPPPSTCYSYQYDLCYRRGSVGSVGEFDSDASVHSAVTTSTAPLPEPSQRPALRRKSSSMSTIASHGSRPHECGYCTRTFSRRHDLERHTRIHTGVKPYVCPCCLKAFPRSDARGRHFRNESSCRAGPQVLAWMKKNTRSNI
ncbi:hypothetical protein BX666DRAFT_1942028 [Dichotomocladium elegans]|nr:hypothetical protein BX666DRAFT_1942028 [Dichotomocladium elegans]